MAIQGTQNTHCFCIFLIFPSIFYFIFLILKKKNKIKTKQLDKNRQTIMKAWKKDVDAWKHDRKVQMYESMDPKADKNSIKESPTLDRKN